MTKTAVFPSCIACFQYSGVLRNHLALRSRPASRTIEGNVTAGNEVCVCSGSCAGCKGGRLRTVVRQRRAVLLKSPTDFIAEKFQRFPISVLALRDTISTSLLLPQPPSIAPRPFGRGLGTRQHNSQLMSPCACAQDYLTLQGCRITNVNEYKFNVVKRAVFVTVHKERSATANTYQYAYTNQQNITTKGRHTHRPGSANSSQHTTTKINTIRKKHCSFLSHDAHMTTQQPVLLVGCVALGAGLAAGETGGDAYNNVPVCTIIPKHVTVFV